MALNFEIQINRDSTVVVGRPDLDVLTAIVTFVRSHDDIQVRTGGMARQDDGGSEQTTWLVRELAIGDEVSIRLVEDQFAAEPISVEREEGYAAERHERAYFERLKRKYERQ